MRGTMSFASGTYEYDKKSYEDLALNKTAATLDVLITILYA